MRSPFLHTLLQRTPFQRALLQRTHFQRTLLLFLLLCCALAVPAQQERPRVALVLGGGGAKGAATVGVLKYIEQSGVPIDMVVGTSIGSIVGGMYARGYRSAQLDSLFRAQDWVGMGMGSLMGDSIVGVLRRMMATTPPAVPGYSVPFRCVAVDVKKLREVVLSDTDTELPQAMRASMAIPLVFKPVKLNGMTLVDGGLLNNLPVDVAKDMGADIVIAIDLTVRQHDDLRSPLAQLLHPDQKKYSQNRAAADIYINPHLKGYHAQDFSPARIAQMISLGEQAGKAQLKALKKLRKKLKSLNKMSE